MSGTHRRAGRVLVVDDEPRIAHLLARLLSDEHRVEVTTSATDALGRLLWGERYDIILCDIVMPEMSGLEFHAEVARRIPAQARRIVFVTGGVTDPAARMRLESTAAVVVEKPVELESIRQIIARFVEQGPVASAAGG